MIFEAEEPSLSNPSSSAPLPWLLRRYALLTLALTALAWAAAAVAPRLGWSYPYSWPLAPRGTAFYDFTDYVERFRYLHRAEFFTAPGYPFTYFAPGVLLYRLFYLPGPQAGLVLYLAFVAIAVLAGCVWFGLALRRAGLRRSAVLGFLIAALLSAQTVAFCVERGNLEVVLACGTLLGLWAYCRGRAMAAAVVWGIVGSVKLYPLIFLALFLSDRHYRALAVALLTTAGAMLLSLWYIGPTIPIAFHGIQLGTHKFVSIYTVHMGAVAMDHSLFALLKRPLYPLGLSLRHLLAFYVPLTLAISLVLYVVRIRNLPRSNQIVILSVCSVLLPPTSFEYSLVQLYGAWGVLVLLAVHAARQGHRVPGLAISLALFALVLSPLNLLAIDDVMLSQQAKCVVLLALLAVAVAVPYADGSDAAPLRRAAPAG